MDILSVKAIFIDLNEYPLLFSEYFLNKDYSSYYAEDIYDKYKYQNLNYTETLKKICFDYLDNLIYKNYEDDILEYDNYLFLNEKINVNVICYDDKKYYIDFNIFCEFTNFDNKNHYDKLKSFLEKIKSNIVIDKIYDIINYKYYSGEWNNLLIHNIIMYHSSMLYDEQNIINIIDLIIKKKYELTYNEFEILCINRIRKFYCNSSIEIIKFIRKNKNLLKTKNFNINDISISMIIYKLIIEYNYDVYKYLCENNFIKNIQFKRIKTQKILETEIFNFKELTVINYLENVEICIKF